MADRWVIAYDIDTKQAEKAEVTTKTVYNRVKTALKDHGFSEFAQRSVYAMKDEDDALVRVYKALQALGALDVKNCIKRLHVFKIDGALNDVLPLVDGRDSASADGDFAADELADEAA